MLFKVVIVLLGCIKELILILWLFNSLLNGVCICKLFSWVSVIFSWVCKVLICVCCLLRSCLEVVFDWCKLEICVNWCLVLLIFVLSFFILVCFFVLFSWISNLFLVVLLLFLKLIVFMVLVICVVIFIDLLVVVVFNDLIVMGNVCDDIKVVFIGVVCMLLLFVFFFLGIFKYIIIFVSSIMLSNKGDKDNCEDIIFFIGKKVFYYVFFKMFRIFKYIKLVYVFL